MEKTYFVTRMFFDGDKKVIKRGLTLEEVQEHCSDPDTSSKTCTTEEGIQLTAEKGPWFDGYDEE